MFDAAVLRGFRKGLRTLIQLIASGGLTLAVNAFAGGLSPGIQTLVGTLWLFIVTFLQNGLEAAGKIPVLFPTVPVIAPVIPAPVIIPAPVVQVPPTPIVEDPIVPDPAVQEPPTGDPAV